MFFLNILLFCEVNLLIFFKDEKKPHLKTIHSSEPFFYGNYWRCRLFHCTSHRFLVRRIGLPKSIGMARIFSV